jgi:hypothetical protein
MQQVGHLIYSQPIKIHQTMSTTTTHEQSTKVITGLVRFSYVKVWKPEAMEDGDKKKYSVSLIISKEDKATLDKINAAVEAAKQDGKKRKWDGKMPPTLKLPLRDGDKERPDDEAYANSYFLNAVCTTKPGIVGTEKDKDGKPKEITDEAEVYSGCYGRASINFYPFNERGNKGVACGLNNIQKVKDGEALGGGRSKASDDFGDDFAADDDDLL